MTFLFKVDGVCTSGLEAINILLPWQSARTPHSGFQRALPGLCELQPLPPSFLCSAAVFQAAVQASVTRWRQRIAIVKLDKQGQLETKKQQKAIPSLKRQPVNVCVEWFLILSEKNC